MRTTDLLNKAIETIDAKFSWQNAGKHLKHAKELGLTPKQYKSRAQELSEKPVGGNIFGYKRSDGSEVKVDKSTKEYVAFRGKKVITHYRLSESQFKRAMKGEY